MTGLEGPFFELARRMVLDPGDAEDAAQEALLRVATHLAQFDRRARFSTWAWRIALNACLDARARRYRLPVMTEEALGADLADGLDRDAPERPEDAALLTEVGRCSARRSGNESPGPGALPFRPRYRTAMAPPTDRRAALGFSSHTGWAAVVAVAGPPGEPSVVAKRRVEMAATFDVGAVYHVGQGLPLEEAEALIRSSEETFHATARAAIAALAAELRGLGLEPIASAVLAGGAKPLPALREILRSHALVHAAEGELYRRVLARASAACSIPASLVPAKDLPARTARAAGVPERRVVSRLAEIGKASGKPWARDQKDAALAAWIALAGSG